MKPILRWNPQRFHHVHSRDSSNSHVHMRSKVADMDRNLWILHSIPHSGHTELQLSPNCSSYITLLGIPWLSLVNVDKAQTTHNKGHKQIWSKAQGRCRHLVAWSKSIDWKKGSEIFLLLLVSVEESWLLCERAHQNVLCVWHFFRGDFLLSAKHMRVQLYWDIPFALLLDTLAMLFQKILVTGNIFQEYVCVPCTACEVIHVFGADQ